MKPEYRELAREAATKSIVLLKNDTHVDACSSESEKAEKILPLQDGTRLGIFGKLAADKGEMTGAWAIGANPEDCVSLLEACEKQGIAYQYSDEDNRIADIVSESDVLIAVLGEKKDQSGEAASRADITLTEEQLALVRNLLATGKPVVAVLFNGRPLAIPYVAEHVPAIVEAWHPGVEAGNALLDILFGKVNPSGRLTTTFPYASGQCPTYYAHINTGRPGGKSKFTSKYLDTPLEPVFPFGYGLSYTQFEYLDQGMEREGDVFRISLKVKNIGARDGQEVVQCYIQNKTAKRVRPVKELKAFEKINIKAGETAEVNFEIPISELGYYDWDMQYITELQDISFYIGSDSQNCIKIDMN